MSDSFDEPSSRPVASRGPGTGEPGSPPPQFIPEYEGALSWMRRHPPVSNPSSAFVHLNVDDSAGIQRNGTEVRIFAAQSGRIVIIGKEPLLEAMPDAKK